MTGFPQIRCRRLRMTCALREMVRETVLAPKDFIYPLFVVGGQNVRREISSMPGVFNLSIDLIVKEASKAWNLGIPAVLLFGVPEHKDETGSEAYSPNGLVQQAARAIKCAVPDLCVILDTCLCEYTSSGHCGPAVNGQVSNDDTLVLLEKVAVSQAQAGADIVAPSGMMDGMVLAIRAALDRAGFPNVAIMSYAAKYASGFYGPFRDAAQSTPAFGDRRSHQLDPANLREAMREVDLDLAEGADIIMVKPAMPYLDVISAVRQRINLPVAAYQVSGEYAMLKAAARLGWLDERRVVLEALTGIKRAGADLIITYAALQAVEWLREG